MSDILLRRACVITKKPAGPLFSCRVTGSLSPLTAFRPCLATKACSRLLAVNLNSCCHRAAGKSPLCLQPAFCEAQFYSEHNYWSKRKPWRKCRLFRKPGGCSDCPWITKDIEDRDNGTSRCHGDHDILHRSAFQPQDFGWSWVAFILNSLLCQG